MADAIMVIKDLLNSNWNVDNTDNVKPIIDSIFAFKRLDLLNKDYVLLYQSGYTTLPIAIGDATKQTTDTISIDIRSGTSRPHAVKVRDEVERILDSKTKNPGSGFQYLKPLSFTDLSDKTVNIWRWVFDVSLIKFATERGT